MMFDHGKVVQTGDANTLKKRFPDAQVTDGKGKTILPGLIDAHGHVLDLGYESTQVALSDTTSLTQAQDAIRAYAQTNPEHAWIQGDGWSQVKWQLGRFPTAAELDAAISDKPALLWRVDGHAAWLNTKALQAAGIAADTRDPVGGRI